MNWFKRIFCKEVLILVLVEDALRVACGLIKYPFVLVLILVLVEDALRGQILQIVVP